MKKETEQTFDEILSQWEKVKADRAYRQECLNRTGPGESPYTKAQEEAWNMREHCLARTLLAAMPEIVYRITRIGRECNVRDVGLNNVPCIKCAGTYTHTTCAWSPPWPSSLVLQDIPLLRCSECGDELLPPSSQAIIDKAIIDHRKYGAQTQGHADPVPPMVEAPPGLEADTEQTGTASRPIPYKPGTESELTMLERVVDERDRAIRALHAIDAKLMESHKQVQGLRVTRAAVVAQGQRCNKMLLDIESLVREIDKIL